jgi:signal transduction histidine kinase
MRFFYKEKKIRNGYITAFGLLTVSYFIVFFIIHQMERRAKLVNHTSEVINTIDILLSCLKDAEISFRNFAFLGDSLAGDAYEYQTRCINSSLASINILVASDPLQIKPYDSLATLIHSKQLLLNNILDYSARNEAINRDSITTVLLESSTMTEETRNIAFRIQTHEKEKLAKTNEFETISKTLKIVHFTTFMIALILVIYSMIVFNNVSRAKLHYREQLEQGIEHLKIANNDLINLRSIEKFAASGRIARTIAHEVKNPLTSISLATEQLSEGIKTEDEKTLIGIISRNAKRINDLIINLLDSTKFSQLKLSSQSLHTVVDEALGLAKDRMELNSIRWTRNISPNPCLVDVDSDKMKTALLNILINAVEAMEPGKGILEITTLRKNEKCQVIIKDNGIGMDEGSLARIFEPYFTQKENGNGLGLTLAQNIILNHKGTIEAESKPGKGTTFTISLTESSQ